jgi:isopenicillin-N N-acyltransferase-like protein
MRMDELKQFRYVKISGKPFERGYQLGNLCKKEIDNTINSYRKIFKKYANIDKDQIKKLATPFIDIIANYDSEIMEEISGIANALGYPIEEIVAINARTELMSQGALEGCTTIALLPEVTRDKSIWIGQNWDWIPMLKESMILLEIEQPERPTILMLTEAGIVGKIGINSKGIGVCLNILFSKDIPNIGIPVHVILRGILNAETLGKAIGAVLKIGSGGCSYFLIGSREEEAIGIEVGFHDAEVIYPTEGILTHANHFVGLKIQRNDRGRIMYPDTLIRDRRALRLLWPNRNSLAIEDLKRVFRDHMNYPHSICRHPDPKGNNLEEIITLVSIIMNLKSGEVYIAEGPPCLNEYTSFIHYK